MKKVLLYGLVISMGLSGCKWFDKDGHIEPDPAFKRYISAFTSGVISKEGTIRVSLMSEVPYDIDPLDLVPADYFSFQPELKGSAYWLDEHTVEFRPDEPMASGETYRVTFNLGKILEVDKQFKQFEFSFSTIQQSFTIRVDGYTTYRTTNLVNNKIEGTVQTADVMYLDDIEQVMQAKQNQRELPIQWYPDKNGSGFHFVVDSVHRYQTPGEVNITWDGGPLDIDQQGKETVEIPSLRDFKVLDVRLVHRPSQHLRIRFSDPLKDQNLDGLIWLSNQTALTFEIDEHIVRAYPSEQQSGEHTLHIETGINNILDNPLPEAHEVFLNFEAQKPAVRMVSKGVIMPRSGSLLLPFEAVNLKAVDVRVIRIYEKNIAQFLQVNALDGNQQLKRVGELVAREKVDLVTQKPVDPGTWNSFSLDLSKLFEPEQGAIYRIELAFRPSYSLFPCDEGETGSDEDINSSQRGNKMVQEQLTYWDAWDHDDNYDNDNNFHQEDQNNPCTPSYYGKHRNVSQNVLVSDLGLIAKRVNNGSIQVFVTDLKTSKPIRNATIEMIDFQLKEIARSKTDKNGMAYVDQLDSKPFLLIANYKGQKGYLRLADSASLPLSKFDVGGENVQNDVKGFIYGDRGVWRPGDTLYLTCILEDKQKYLPGDRPVIFGLFDPTGREVDRKVLYEGMNGFYHFRTHTEPDAPTGNYCARVKTGDIEFSKTIRIEAIKPNRLKINVGLDKAHLYASDAVINTRMQVNWMRGAPARDLDVEIDYTLQNRSTTFPGYGDFNFTDPSRHFQAKEDVFYAGNTGNNGQAIVKGDIKPANEVPGMLQVTFSTRVYENNDAFSTDRYSIPFSPYPGYTGIKLSEPANGYALETEKGHVAEIVTLTEKGAPVRRDGLQVSLYKLQWRWWGNGTEDNLAAYEENKYTRLMADSTINTNQDGKGAFRFQVDDADWGRYFLRVHDQETGHATGKVFYVDRPGWQSVNNDEKPGGASALIFDTDKEEYLTGEKAYINLPGSHGARALVSLENGSGILDAFWVKDITQDTLVGFDIKPEMAPNFYVHVTMIRPHTHTKNHLPMRRYGVIPLRVTDPQSILTPVIKMPDQLAPEKPFTINVSEKTGKKMTYTIAIVDEDLLDVTRYQTPDPWNHFYARQALGVRTWDIYDLVMGTNGGRDERIFGNDSTPDEVAPEVINRENRFKPVVLFEGPFTLQTNQAHNHTFTVPNYIGSVKTMVIGGNHGVYGKTENVTPVQEPVKVLATLPGVLRPQETVQIPVTIFAMEEDNQTVDIEVKSNDLLIPAGPTNKAVSFSQAGEKTVHFAFQVNAKTGLATVNLSARSGMDSSRHEIERDVRNPNLPVTEVMNEAVEPGETWSKEFAHAGIAGTNSGILEISSIPPFDLTRRLKSLLHYPHGGAEQVTSAVFAQLYLEDILDDKAHVLKRADTHIQSGIHELKSFFTREGGFSDWPGSQQANQWVTSYVGHFLLEAEGKGYNLPSGMKKQWIQYQVRQARKWSFLDDKHGQTQAYRLYTLAKAGEYRMDDMNRLRQSTSLSVQSKWILASAYILAGQTGIARDLITDLGTEVPDSVVSDHTYGSSARDRAMILETLFLLDEQTRIMPLAHEIAGELSSDRWMSTQTTAYCLMVMSKFAIREKSKESLNFEYKLNTGKVLKARTKKPLMQINIPMEESVHSLAYIKNNGNNTLFAQVINTGVPAMGNEVAKSENLDMLVQYRDMDGNPINTDRLEQGTNFKAVVRVTNPSQERYQNLALSQILPSGWEMNNARLEKAGTSDNYDDPDYQDIGDDRVNTYFDLDKGQSKTFAVYLKALDLGTFHLPSVWCEAMYNNTIYSRTAGKEVKVVLPGE